jgi:hypothetical protein
LEYKSSTTLEQLAIIESLSPSQPHPTRGHLYSSQSALIDDLIYLWTAGQNSVAIIDAYNMQYEIVNGLGGNEGLPLGAVSASHGRKVVTLTTRSKPQGDFLNYWQMGSQVKTIPVESIHPSVHSLHTIDQTRDSRVILCAGGDTKGILIAVSFDGHFDLVAKIEFEQKVCRVRRLAHSDIFMVGGVGSLHFVEFRDRKLTLLATLPRLGEHVISWIQNRGQEVYLLDEEGRTLRTLKFGFDLERFDRDIMPG